MQIRKSLAVLILVGATACAGASTSPKDSTATTRASANASQTTTALDGMWSTSFTRDELAASSLLIDAEEVNDQNWGEQTLTLQDGQVRFSQQNDIYRTSASGTFTVSADEVVFSFTEGVVMGETFGFRWSLDGDTLTFTREDSMVGPTPYLIKPWTRVQ